MNDLSDSFLSFSRNATELAPLHVEKEISSFITVSCVRALGFYLILLRRANLGFQAKLAYGGSIQVNVGSVALLGKKLVVTFEWAQNLNYMSPVKWLGLFQSMLSMYLSYRTLPESQGNDIHLGRQRTQCCLEDEPHILTLGSISLWLLECKCKPCHFQDVPTSWTLGPT